MLRRMKPNMKSRFVEELELGQRQMWLKVKRFSRCGKILFGVSLVLSLMLYLWLGYLFFANPLKSDSFTEVDKCPSCYGTHLCDDFKAGKVSFTGYSRLTPLHFANTKNVFFGSHGDKAVVVKRLAKTRELKALDAKVCEMAGHSKECEVSRAIQNVAGASGTKWMMDLLKGHSDMMRCPTERLMVRILHQYVEKRDAVDLSAVEKMQLITTLIYNPEPIMLQTFPKSDGWPFAAYHGACGRLVVEEYAGTQLGDFYDHPFPDRVKLAYQVMQIADKLTDNDSQHALYWTDVSYENLVVDAAGNVVVADAENIVVVDRWQIKHDKKVGWDEPHYSSFDECHDRLSNCISYSPDLLCTRYTADHNYYVACRNLLSSYASDGSKTGGLLHDIPQEVEHQHNLRAMVDECAKPASPDGRLRIKDDLLEALKKLSFLYA